MQKENKLEAVVPTLSIEDGSAEAAWERVHFPF